MITLSNSTQISPKLFSIITPLIIVLLIVECRSVHTHTHSDTDNSQTQLTHPTESLMHTHNCTHTHNSHLHKLITLHIHTLSSTQLTSN